MNSEAISREYKCWYENGRLERREFYKNGKREGEFKIWHVNGLLNSCEFYQDGQREGFQRYWWSDGAVYCHEFYRNGVRIYLTPEWRKMLKVCRMRRYSHNTLSMHKTVIPDLLKLIFS